MARQGFATFENGAGGCYKPTVNEPETMTDAKLIDGRFCLQSGASGLRRRSGRFALVAAVARNIERS